MLNRGLDKQELLRVVDSVANEKSIDKELILNSMEMAIQKAAYSKFGLENEIEAKIDRESGELKFIKF
jgi:N utilization substance protein A